MPSQNKRTAPVKQPPAKQPSVSPVNPQPIRTEGDIFKLYLENLNRSYLLPHRRGVKNANEAKALDQKVLELAEKLPLFYTNARDLNSARSMSSRSVNNAIIRIRIASQLVMMAKERPELLNDLPEKIFISQNPRPHTNNWRGEQGGNGIFFREDELNDELLKPPDSRNLVVHEFTHYWAQNKETKQSKKEFLPNMSASEKGSFIEGRKELFQQYQKAKLKADTLSARSGKWPTPAEWNDVESIKGLRNYAFSSDEEFLSVITELYFGTPEKLKEISPKLFEAYQSYFQKVPTP